MLHRYFHRLRRLCRCRGRIFRPLLYYRSASPCRPSVSASVWAPGIHRRDLRHPSPSSDLSQSDKSTRFIISRVMRHPGSSRSESSVPSLPLSSSDPPPPPRILLRLTAPSIGSLTSELDGRRGDTVSTIQFITTCPSPCISLYIKIEKRKKKK